MTVVESVLKMKLPSKCYLMLKVYRRSPVASVEAETFVSVIRTVPDLK